MNVHPVRSQVRERLNTIFEFLNGRFTNALKRTAERKIVRRVPHHGKIMIGKNLARFFEVHLPDGCRGRLQCEVHELEPHFRHPLDLRTDRAGRMIHRANQHTFNPYAAYTSSTLSRGCNAANHARVSSSRIRAISSSGDIIGWLSRPKRARNPSGKSAALLGVSHPNNVKIDFNTGRSGPKRCRTRSQSSSGPTA